MPTDTPSAPSPQPNVPYSPWSKAGHQADQFTAFSQTLAAGQSVTWFARFYVPRWKVGVVAAAGVRVSVYAGNGTAGIGLPLGGGGKLTIPGNEDALTVVNTGANPAVVTALAIRGLDFIDYDPGALV